MSSKRKADPLLLRRRDLGAAALALGEPAASQNGVWSISIQPLKTVGSLHGGVDC